MLSCNLPAYTWSVPVHQLSTLYILYIPLQMQKHRKKTEKLSKKQRKKNTVRNLKKQQQPENRLLKVNLEQILVDKKI